MKTFEDLTKLLDKVSLIDKNLRYVYVPKNFKHEERPYAVIGWSTETTKIHDLNAHLNKNYSYHMIEGEYRSDSFSAKTIDELYKKLDDEYKKISKDDIDKREQAINKMTCNTAYEVAVLERIKSDLNENK
jgi:uncharacterized protein YcnI